MKNIHILPTVKPSRLRYNLSNVLVLTKELYRDYSKQVNQNIYIPSDEEIKEGDIFIHPDGTIERASRNLDGRGISKIILTTDEDLIKNGVQAIDDEFLEWFVKNPSCEKVEVQKWSSLAECGYSYHIIIPKEEPKVMKNIHILPTDKPSRLIKDFNNKLLLTNGDVQSLRDGYQFQNIYITSDVEIKEGDWIFDLDVKRVVKADNLKVITSKKSQCWYYKKIILTTDLELQKDCVQAIDDRFLEWFVKNPSCESVKIQLEVGSLRWSDSKNTYKIIIPKEEYPKQEYEYIGECKGNNGNGCFMDSSAHNCGCFVRVPKQETLEEAYLNKLIDEANKEFTLDRKLAKEVAIKFSKWQAERMYSEADKIMKFLDTEIKLGLSDIKTIERVKWYFETYFEQFKKQ